MFAVYGSKYLNIMFVIQENIPPPLKNELVVDRLAAVQVKPSHDALKKEALDLEVQIKQVQDALDTLVRIQQRSLESNLYNKVNELQEDISMKRFDLRVAQIHLSAINHQVSSSVIRLLFYCYEWRGDCTSSPWSRGQYNKY